MYKRVIIIGSLFLCACAGITKQDARQLSSFVALNNQVSVKRQRSFVISPASSVALLLTGQPIKYDYIVDGFKYHFRQVALIDEGKLLNTDHDFVFKIEVLNLDLQHIPKKIGAAVITRADTKTKGNKKGRQPVKRKPLQMAMKIVLKDAISSRVLDIAIVDAYSSALKKPEKHHFVKDVVNRYIQTLTTI